ncbi:hypothetical protein ACFSR7_21520 [Cohnella sp. GCM10020058]|uniref:hypothetical protein n=1 Tax=Cohnella sp. GCM10020058 TaxID=3317330 RepID=UPI00363844B0
MGSEPFWNFQTDAQVATLAKEFARGYYAAINSSSDTTSSLVLIISTNNGVAQSQTMGTKWANIVINANNLASAYISRTIIYGGNDMEVGFVSTVAQTKSWVTGYNATPGRYAFMNTGDAGGCPISGGNYSSSTTCTVTTSTYTNSYDMGSMLFISYSGAGYPLPQIYRSDGAQAFQWQRIARYYYDSHSQATMIVKGSISQEQACTVTNDPCTGIKNSPITAFNQLQNKLNADTGTSQTVSYATDVTW